MIIECKNCLKKFTVRDSDIPNKGRTVQCGNCSTQWFQMPIDPSVTTKKLDLDNIAQKPPKISSPVTTENVDVDVVDQEPAKNEFKASDGKNYRFLGNQWAEVLPLGKAGRLARKKISKELNKLAGIKHVKKSRTINKSIQSENQYKETERGMGIFSFLIVLIMFVAAIILALDTFKHQLIPFFPNLDNYLLYIFETLNNIYIIIKDLINNYK